jgi:hypothetical protein
MRDSKLAVVMGLMTALVSLSVGLMRDSRAILVIGLLLVLASLASALLVGSSVGDRDRKTRGES